jgi:rSAM/selenodomain-associated transferase 1
VLAFAPENAEPYFKNLVQERFHLAPQTNGDLGQRMNDFFNARFQERAEKVVLLGTDSPTVPLDFVDQAFQELEQADVVLGPATDGGYYLIGCSRRLPPIFEGISWSSPQVLCETISRLKDTSWRLALLPPWYDIDTLDDWHMLKGHLAALRKAGQPVDLPHTSALI